MGLIFDDYHFFRTQFEEHGVFHRTVMFVNQASDPIVERLLVPDLALAVAEEFAVKESKRVLLTDMTAFADATKELGIAEERIAADMLRDAQARGRLHTTQTLHRERATRRVHATALQSRNFPVFSWNRLTTAVV
jgi:vacuolar-type H+-ATPase subunit B/Vma2